MIYIYLYNLQIFNYEEVRDIDTYIQLIFIFLKKLILNTGLDTDMEEFNALSLTSSCQDDTLEESDLLAMSNLSISERKPMPEELINKFLPYTPPCPSPLRATVSIPKSDHDDLMEIDEIYDIAGNEDKKIQGTQNGKMKDGVGEDLLVEDTEDTYLDSKGEQTGLIKTLLSPTSLGIALATRDLENKPEPSNDESANAATEIPVEPINSKLDSTVGSSSTSTSIHDLPSVSEEKLHSRYPDSQKPWQIQVQNHHYYYMVPDRTPQSNEFYHETSMPQTSEHLDRKELPLPWSSESNPASKASYAFTTYLQMALNIITVMIICSTITAFAKAVRTDIKSTWEHRKLELDFESANCKVEYLANHCNQDEVVPALLEQCNQWGKCMNRNNDIYFRARTSLGARLFGEIINSLIEPLGWKALIVILLTLAIWCFSSNFLLGFMRAKSYYGTPTPHTQLTHSSQPLQPLRPTESMNNITKGPHPNSMKQLEPPAAS